jgi:very-short-patch-repair endonuclease
MHDLIDDLCPLPDPTALPRVLTRDDAVRWGFSRNAIRHRVEIGRWRRVLPRTYLTVDTFTWTDHLRAALAFAGEGALLSGGAALFGPDLRSVQRPTTVLVLVPYSCRARSTRWVRVRRTRRFPPAALAPGPRRAPTARAVADLALELRTLDDVRAVVAEVVRRECCDVGELATELEDGPRNGSAFLREAIDEVGAGAWSAPEARAATLLRRAGLPEFEQNARIELSNGRYVIADFLWRSLRAVLEIDSDAHHALAGDADRTSDRHLWLSTDGYSVVHRTPRAVYRQPDAFVAGIEAWLAGRTTILR